MSAIQKQSRFALIKSLIELVLEFQVLVGIDNSMIEKMSMSQLLTMDNLYFHYDHESAYSNMPCWLSYFIPLCSSWLSYFTWGTFLYRFASQFAFMNLVSSFLQFLFCLELTLDLLTGLYIEIWVMVLAESWALCKSKMSFLALEITTSLGMSFSSKINRFLACQML